ncbi:glyoxylase-like metal-dependent hydrolase (beta-lactamase superfamily II) [Devosia subaequoris]|uniref:Glyoxylase-like metal-dependent hydrolase (Beta-lactamase superfamily II) n=1 Tax=Devosia subaequoris TaxID=395930 RepID=A0A7W6IPG9_9HYPH|nr:MBL fold metallo-hydrolase [Devosia subaequoris]MBB4053325.1 glyoxylase-like metal-dependent hydrolase (beta-lactamase superfamily II) [Devosia subaequoris]MCP1210546.1 MBL fold metallo-hydrolase [Devosia subaequoris]
MARTTHELHFDTQFDAQAGGPIAIAEGIVRVTAPNASPFTFTGTNSFLVGHHELALIDPGPLDPAHEAALLKAIGGRPVAAILLTHTHRDHSASAKTLAQKLGAPLWFGGPHRLSRPLRRFEINPIRNSCDWDLMPDRTLRDGETIPAGDMAVSVHTTPGHCANHLAFGVAGSDLLFSGDHVMGWNSTLVSVPDGSMADYFTSLDKLTALPYRRYLPAHGGAISDGPSHAAALKAHRAMRNQQVLDAVGGGARSVGAVVEALYPTQPAKVRMAARMTIMAHVEYLEDLGQLKVQRGLLGPRLTLART